MILVRSTLPWRINRRLDLGQGLSETAGVTFATSDKANF